MSDISIADIKHMISHCIHDRRLGKSHVNLYMALCSVWMDQQCPQWIRAFSYQIMPVAKISSSATYVKTMNELEQFGFISYKRSLYKGRPSQIELKR